jgi:hypothetical protein
MQQIILRAGSHLLVDIAATPARPNLWGKSHEIAGVAATGWRIADVNLTETDPDDGGVRREFESR